VEYCSYHGAIVSVLLTYRLSTANAKEQSCGSQRGDNMCLHDNTPSFRQESEGFF
jgi:hypothetical protein